MKTIIQHSLNEAFHTIEKFVSNSTVADSIFSASKIISTALLKGGKVIACGNGGSLCDATHFAEELTGRFRNNRCPLPAIAINDSAHITCVANDYGYDEVFSRYVDAFGNSKDVLLVFSTSGNSENVFRAVLKAHEKGLKTIALTRKEENKLSKIADVVIAVDHSGYSDRIQEMHIIAVHIMIECIEKNYFQKKTSPKH